jgi:16S rRNA (guanine527-N7)-methyltransferase
VGGDPSAQTGAESERSALVAVLEEARGQGFLGPGPVEAQIGLALGLAAAVRAMEQLPRSLLDLGSGGGVPGLVLALQWPTTRWLLLESKVRRTTFLVWAVDQLGLSDRVGVRCQRAELAGRDPELRGSVDVVMARGFGPPPVTAECGAPFLKVGGRLVVAEPPVSSPTRWPASGLALVGLRPAQRGGGGQPAGGGEAERSPTSGPAWIALEQERPCPEPYPRPVGRPAKRPLFAVVREG